MVCTAPSLLPSAGYPSFQRHIACLPERRDGGDQPLPDVRRMPAAGGMRERKKDTRNQKPENCQAHKRKERMERRGSVSQSAKSFRTSELGLLAPIAKICIRADGLTHGMPAAIGGVSLVGIQNEAGGAIRGRAGEIPREKRGEEKGGKTTHSSRLSAKPLPSLHPSQLPFASV